MIRYETLLLATPEITSDEVKLLESHFERVLGDHKAALISFERWGKYALAYPVRRNEYGVYFLTRFEVESENVSKLLTDLETLLKVKLTDTVMRHITCVLDPNMPLAYDRPESLEEAPARDVDTFLSDERKPFFNKRAQQIHFSRDSEQKESGERGGDKDEMSDKDEN